MAQATKEKPTSKNETDEQLSDAQLKVAQEVGQTTLDNVSDEDIDNILADIDDVLEENAQEFVNNFVQKGGQ